MRYVSILAAVIIVLGVACSSGDDKPAAGSQATSAPQPTVAPTAAAPALPQLAAATLSGAPGGSAQPRVNGVVQSVADGKVMLQDGTSFMLAANARISRLKGIKPTDLAKGQFVAITSKRQPDNTLLASVVSIFPASLSGVVPGGERPLPEGNLMTNATIDTITGNTFTVTFTGGGARVTLAPDTVVVQQLDATAADLTPGTKINAGVNNGAAASVLIQ